MLLLYRIYEMHSLPLHGGVFQAENNTPCALRIKEMPYNKECFHAMVQTKQTITKQ